MPSDVLLMGLDGKRFRMIFVRLETSEVLNVEAFSESVMFTACLDEIARDKPYGNSDACSDGTNTIVTILIRPISFGLPMNAV